MSEKMRSGRVDVLASPTPQAWIDLSVGLFLLGWAAVGWFGVIGNPDLLEAQLSLLAAGPALVPSVVLSVLTLGGTGILIKGISALTRCREIGQIDWAQHRYAMALICSLAILVAAMQEAGFLLSTLVFCCGWLLTLSRRIVRDSIKVISMAISCSALISGLVYLVFAELVKVPLP